MRGILVFSFIVAVAAIPQGYNYRPGHTQTSSSIKGESSIVNPRYSHQGRPSQSYSHSGSHSHSTFGSGSGHSGGPAFTSHATSGSGISEPNYSGFSDSVSAEPSIGIVTKNFYTLTAPEETEDDIQEDSESTGPTNKKYNIVFVKSPGQSAKSAALALRKAQSNEKNIIYVLTKKLDVSELQNALSTTDANANKPEVVFIKYKTPAEASQAQNYIQEQYESLGEGPTFVGEEEIAPVSSAVGSLGSSTGHSGHHAHAISHAHDEHDGAEAIQTHGTVHGHEDEISEGSQGYLPPTL